MEYLKPIRRAFLYLTQKCRSIFSDQSKDKNFSKAKAVFNLFSFLKTGCVQDLFERCALPEMKWRAMGIVWVRGWYSGLSPLY